MTPVQRHEAKLRTLVEQAGFELAININQGAAFQIVTKDLELVAHAHVDARGFTAVFPRTGRVSHTPTDLVDDLDDWVAATRRIQQ